MLFQSWTITLKCLDRYLDHVFVSFFNSYISLTWLQILQQYVLLFSQAVNNANEFVITWSLDLLVRCPGVYMTYWKLFEGTKSSFQLISMMGPTVSFCIWSYLVIVSYTKEI